MPRRGPGDPDLQLALVTRMVEDMERRGLSDAAVARLASSFYPVTANTIWKIRCADRRVSIDEADALARGLGYDGVYGLVHRTALALPHRDTELLDEIADLLSSRR